MAEQPWSHSCAMQRALRALTFQARDGCWNSLSTVARGGAVLQVVAAPIGNLADMSPRVAASLVNADVILAESSKIKTYLAAAKRIRGVDGPEPPHVLCTEATAAVESHRMVCAVQASTVRTIALCSDAGTPALSDPGARVVRAFHEAGIRVQAVPGPCAVSAALSVSGEESRDGYLFTGWVPLHGADRARWLETVSSHVERPVICFESPRRVEALFNTLALDHGPASRPVVICRDMTKPHEQVIRLPSFEAVLAWLRESEFHTKGEFTIVLGRKAAT
jgi:16S rRNA (cytidine1402-2'-O)-methyltransferase